MKTPDKGKRHGQKAGVKKITSPADTRDTRDTRPAEDRIERTDWDFSTCPESQLELCFDYERARHSRREIAEVGQWRRDFPGKTFDALFQHVESAADWVPNAFYLFPEFPDIPFLSIGAAERNRRFARLEAFGVNPAVCDPGEWFNESFPELASDFPKTEGTHHKGFAYETRGKAITCPQLRCAFAAFRFDWQWSDETYIQLLKAWLGRNRDRSVQIKETRGKGNEVARFKSDLKTIGAFRLLKRMPWTEALLLTKEQSGKPLFSNHQPAWSRAAAAGGKLCNG